MRWYPVEIRHTATEAAEQHAYDAIYSTAGINQRSSLYRWFLAHVTRHVGPGRRLLDVSCGAGTLLTLARAAGLHVVGIDFSLAALQKAAHHTSRLSAANAQALPFADNSFDAVTNLGSLEHYFDIAAGTREMARVLRPDGVAVILVPNTFGLFGNIIYVWQHGEIFDDGQPLQRYAARASWEELFMANGLAPISVAGYEQAAPRTLADAGWMLRHPSKIARLLISPLVPVNLSNILVFTCRKRATR